MAIGTQDGVVCSDTLGYVDQAAVDHVSSLGPVLAVVASLPRLCGCRTE